jgi:hypothetical protein
MPKLDFTKLPPNYVLQTTTHQRLRPGRREAF